jgi:hypothetical protein
MNTTTWVRILLSTTLGYAAAASASTSIIQMDFSGVGTEDILDYYNGNTDGVGPSGANFGVLFGGGLVGALNNEAGALFAGEPTPPSIAVMTERTALIQVASGFTQGLSFYYTNVDEPAFVNIYEGLDASGNRLGRLKLDKLGEGPVFDRPYSNWRPVSISFTGVAKSITFDSPKGNELGFDNLTLGSLNPHIPAVPEPSTAVQLVFGAALLAFVRRRLRSRSAISA